MSESPPRVVFDCNTLLQAMSSTTGPAGECMARAIAGSAHLFVSTPIIDEFREATLRPRVFRKLRLTEERVRQFLVTLEATATRLENFPEPFYYLRDPDDSMYVNLALACGGKLIVSRDKDLLDLMSDANADGKALRAEHATFQVLTPPQFLSTLPARS